jgi:hypothetical protein
MTFNARPAHPIPRWRIVVGVIAILLVACAAGKPIEGSLGTPGDYVALHLTPPVVILDPNGTANFQATAELSDGSENPAIGALFEATGGTIDDQGHYQAGPTPGDFRVIASLGGRSDTSLVQISPFPSRTLVGVDLTPATIALVPGGTQQFVATGLLSDGADSAIAIDWTSTGGSVNAAGLYTAPAQTGNYLVTATQQGGTLSDTARVTVAVLLPTLTAVILTPATASLQFGQTQQFTALGQLNDGSTTVITITWSATGGTITSSGRYTAGNTAGTYRAIARAANGMADTSSVTVAAPTITSLVLTPATAALQTGQIQQFSVSATLSNGTTQSNPSVTYAVTGGTITSGGLYTAGGIEGSFQVIARAASGVADTSAVTITAANITAITLAPSSATVNTGQTQQFIAAATLSNGGIQPNPAVTWSATGGTITTGGLYTAGSSTGSFRVIAVQQSGSPADTSVVTVTAAPPSNMYFNSSEAGCGTDSNVLLCDDFEDGDWYTKNCDQANGSGGLLQTDGWCGTIYNNAGLAAGTARCGGAGLKSTCTATTGVLSGTTGNMADHALAQGVNEVWVRFYTKPLAGYQFGAEKMLTFNDGAAGGGGIRWGNLSWNCASTTASTGQLTMGFPPPMDVCQSQNVGNGITIQSGNWYFYEVHYRLSSPGAADGVFELWVDSCGPNGTACPATPTLRMRRTDVRNDRTSTSELIRVLWFEAWSNPTSQGERYLDQIKVSKVGPIGFMP